MAQPQGSVFKKYYTDQPFVDRFLLGKEPGIDVIIPIIHTNELWEADLRSLYREVPVNRLLIGDGGCIDGSVDIARKFPRVIIQDHKAYKTLGFSIRKLIESVETEWFLYPHSDVYFPEGWFDVMKKYQGKYDWYGCTMRHTVMVEYDVPYGERPWAGTQIGRTKAFGKGLEKIDDDFIYRQEDFVWRRIIEENGFKEGRVDETFHYHQTMHRPTPTGRKVKEVRLVTDMTREEDIRTWDMQVRGIIKYLRPDSDWKIQTLDGGLYRLLELKAIDWAEFKRWVAVTNPEWLAYISKRRFLHRRFGSLLKLLFRLVIGN
jgi:hypothetical protein